MTTTMLAQAENQILRDALEALNKDNRILNRQNSRYAAENARLRRELVRLRRRFVEAMSGPVEV